MTWPQGLRLQLARGSKLKEKLNLPALHMDLKG